MSTLHFESLVNSPRFDSWPDGYLHGLRTEGMNGETPLHKSKSDPEPLSLLAGSTFEGFRAERFVGPQKLHHGSLRSERANALTFGTILRPIENGDEKGEPQCNDATRGDV
jgi:hypothetical protein